MRNEISTAKCSHQSAPSSMLNAASGLSITLMLRVVVALPSDTVAIAVVHSLGGPRTPCCSLLLERLSTSPQRVATSFEQTESMTPVSSKALAGLPFTSTVR